MLPISCASLLVYLFSFAQPVSTTAVQPAVQVRTLPGQSIQDTYNVVKRGLAMASLEKRGNHTAEIPLAKSWKDSTIIYIEMAAASGDVDIHTGIKVQCKHCYMLGNVKAELTIDDNFNATAALESTINEVKQEFLNFTDTVGDYLENYAETVVANLEDGPDWSDFELPTFPYAFDLDIPSLPETNIRFQFDQMELYMELETTMNAGATYELPLYSSKSPLGIELGELQLGFVLTLDLILAVDGEIAVQNGFHIKLDDGVALNIALFGDKISDMTFNGGQFEFLPVTIESAGITLSAALRVGVSCGIGVGTTDKSVFNLDTGMEVAVFANIAEFAATVKHEPENKDCALQVIQEYKFAIGAVAGASIEIDAPVIGTKTLAAVAGVSTAIYTTTLDEVCAIEMTVSAVDASITTPAVKRDDLTTTTLSTEFERSAIYCKVTGIANCPVSEQVTTRTSVTQYLTTAVASDWSSSEFPQNTFESVASVVTFGKAANRILAMSGSPTMYTAAPTNAIDGVLSGSVGSVSKKLVVGLSVGLGVPILIAAVAGLLLCQRRRKRALLASTGPAMVAQTYTMESSYGASPDLKKAGVNVNVLQR